MTRKPPWTNSSAGTGGPRLAHLHRVRAGGRVYYYAFRGGPRLPDPDADPIGFAAAYAAAHEARAAAQPPPPPPPSGPRTLADLLELYREAIDDGRVRLAASTAREYRRTLALIAAASIGELSIAALGTPRARAHVLAWRDAHADTPRAADYGIEVLSAAMSWAIDRALATGNPARGIGALHRSDRSDLIWSPWELLALVAAARPEPARAIALAAETGLRRGDLVALRWDEVDEAAGVIERRTLKSGGRASVFVPILPGAAAILAACPRTADTVLTNAQGRPWTANGLSSAFHDARAVLGPAAAHLRLHDLRGTAATRFAASGLSDREIADLMGWEERAVARIRRRYVSRAAMAAALARRLRGE